MLTWTGKDIEHVILKRGVFLALIDEATSLACAATWEAGSLSDTDTRRFDTLVHEMESKFESGANLKFKLIGEESVVRSLKERLTDQNKLVSKSIPCRVPIEILFHAKVGRIQVAEKPPLPVETSTPSKVKVLIVDDSKTIRTLLTRILSEDPSIEVLGVAENPLVAEPMIKKLKPNVITLDIHMPEMDGVTFLAKMLPIYQIPTIMISSISKEEGPQVLSALELGAVDYVQKPTADQLSVVGPMIVEKVKMAAHAKITLTKKRVLHRLSGALRQDLLVAIGSSTGGTEALKAVLTRLPENFPPSLIVQHIPPVFSKAFAERMNELCAVEVKEAEDNDEVVSGRVLVAPGGFQMRLVRKGQSLRVKIENTPPVNRHKPSVDVMFDSVADICGKNSLGVILTGMGADGAKGLLKMKTKGARTIAQDEKSCVVFGMPREAILLGAAGEILSLDDIPEKLIQWLSTSASKKPLRHSAKAS